MKSDFNKELKLDFNSGEQINLELIRKRLFVIILRGIII